MTVAIIFKFHLINKKKKKNHPVIQDEPKVPSYLSFFNKNIKTSKYKKQQKFY